MNCVSLMGRLTKTPEMKIIGEGKSVVNFTLAVENQGQEAIFINCQAWNKTAEFVNTYFAKGVRVGVQGRLNVRSWENNGKRVYVTEVIAERVFFADGKKENSPVSYSKPETFETYTVTDDNELPF